METTQLLESMADIHKNILPQNHKQFILDIWFKLRNESLITSFIWVIRETHTQLYPFDQYNWGTKLIEVINLCDEINEGILIYLYDGTELKPLFIQAALLMATEQKKTGKVDFPFPFKQSINSITRTDYERKY